MSFELSIDLQCRIILRSGDVLALSEPVAAGKAGGAFGIPASDPTTYPLRRREMSTGTLQEKTVALRARDQDI